MSDPLPIRRSEGLRTAAIAVGLLVLTLAAYGQVATFEFVNFDDDAHVYENPHVRTGLTADNLVWDFGIHGPSQWHPLAWISHQLDCTLFGLRPGAHHLSNLGLHAASVVLLWYALLRMTGCAWRSAFVAALFAVHPLNIESVAWVSERRNVLSTLFGMLTLLAYVRYTSRISLGRYLTVVLLFGLGLMAKPLLVTLPCVLLLLDCWPLGRVRGTRNLAFLLVEKLPLLALSAVSSVLSYQCQQQAGVVASLGAIPFDLRIANALVVYVTYLRKMFWPVDLAPFYPHPALFGTDFRAAVMGPAAASALLLLAVTALALWNVRRRPYLAVGWFWYLGTLVPMIGLVQVGEQQMADRYTYIPLVGVFIAATWFVADVTPERWRQRKVLPVLGAACIAALSFSTWEYVKVWKDSIALFSHTLAVTDRNAWAHNNLGIALHKAGRATEAMTHLRAAIDIDPRYALAYYNLGVVLYDQGHPDEAIPLFEQSRHLNPSHAPAWDRLGSARGQQGRLSEAIGCFRQAIRIDPEYASAHLNLGIALGRSGNASEGLPHLRLAVKLDPGFAGARNALAFGLLGAGLLDEARQQFTVALQLNPNLAEGHFGLALVLLQQGAVAAASEHLQRALIIRPDYPEARQIVEQLFPAAPKKR